MTVAWAIELTGTTIPRRSRSEYLQPHNSAASSSSWCLRMKSRRRLATPELAVLSTGALSSYRHRQHNVDKTMVAVAMASNSKTEEEERLEQWMRDSIAEIVRNIGDAPFLVQIFSRGDDDDLINKRVKVRERSRTSWQRIKNRWEQEKCVPDGVVLVEELVTAAPSSSSQDREGEGKETRRTWGLVVQGRDMMCPPACYILNTCRVPSSVGFCTHFCLIKACCLGEALDAQLRNAWLHDGP